MSSTRRSTASAIAPPQSPNTISGTSPTAPSMPDPERRAGDVVDLHGHGDGGHGEADERDRVARSRAGGSARAAAASGRSPAPRANRSARRRSRRREGRPRGRRARDSFDGSGAGGGVAGRHARHYLPAVGARRRPTGRGSSPRQHRLQTPRERVADEHDGVQHPQPQQQRAGDADAEQPAEGRARSIGSEQNTRNPCRKPETNAPVTTAPAKATRHGSRPGPTTRNVHVSGSQVSTQTTLSDT